jgi:pre-mRNA-processing factor 40
MALFKQLGVDVLTRWRSAHSLVLESDSWQNDEELKQLPGLDILLAFEDYSRVREREFEDEMRRKQVHKSRSERKAREAFKVPPYSSPRRSFLSSWTHTGPSARVCYLW